MAQQESTVLEPRQADPKPASLWHVVLLDDDQHTYEYVIEMICKLFGRDAEIAYRMAVEVDSTGRVIVETTTLERAELKRDQIHAYGPDPRIERCKGSMRCTLEPAA
jgi:ATP-dependent Clp protease adaptor protein ClpS